MGVGVGIEIWFEFLGVWLICEGTGIIFGIVFRRGLLLIC
jgi:hypothetical protein